MSDLWFFSFTVVHKWYAFFRNYALNFTVWCLTIASGQPCDCRGEQQIHSQPFFTPTTIRLFTFSMVACLVTKSCLTRRLHGLYPARLLCPWNFPGKNTGVGCHFLLQGNFLIQGLNPVLLNCRQILYQPIIQTSKYFFTIHFCIIKFLYFL